MECSELSDWIFRLSSGNFSPVSESKAGAGGRILTFRLKFLQLPILLFLFFLFLLYMTFKENCIFESTMVGSSFPIYFSNSFWQRSSWFSLKFLFTEKYVEWSQTLWLRPQSTDRIFQNLTDTTNNIALLPLQMVLGFRHE